MADTGRVPRLVAKAHALAVTRAAAREQERLDAEQDLRLAPERLRLEELQLQAAAAERTRQADEDLAALRREHERNLLLDAERERQRAKTDQERTRRRTSRAAWRSGFLVKAMDNTIVLLVIFAVATAWIGQFGFLLGLLVAQVGVVLAPVFAATGAAALECIGLLMGSIARQAATYRDRAVRARLAMWGVILFSAWSNYTHYGLVMAAMSLLGPIAWEVREWWGSRHRAYQAGALVARPVRPRFPIDRWVLFPASTWTAYRVAVRDNIGDAETALAGAAAAHRARWRSAWHRGYRHGARHRSQAVQRAHAALRELPALRDRNTALHNELTGFTRAVSTVLGADLTGLARESDEAGTSDGGAVASQTTLRRRFTWLRGKGATEEESTQDSDARTQARENATTSADTAPATRGNRQKAKQVREQQALELARTERASGTPLKRREVHRALGGRWDTAQAAMTAARARVAREPEAGIDSEPGAAAPAAPDSAAVEATNVA